FADTVWSLPVTGDITVGTTAQAWAQVNPSGIRLARAASTANVATLSGTTTIDGVALSAGEYVLLKDQSTSAQNGLYRVASGTWFKASTPRAVIVTGGTAGGRMMYFPGASNSWAANYGVLA